MDAEAALADLTDISAQVEAAALFTAEGALLASTLSGPDKARAFVETVQDLLNGAEVIGAGGAQVSQLEVALEGGSVFVVRSSGDVLVAATTEADPTVGLVLYDLKSCLRSLEREPEALASDGAIDTEAPADAT